MSMYDCRQIGSYPTTLPLMRTFVDKIKAMEGKDGVLSISIGHCFPYADVPELGGRILVVMDKDKAAAESSSSATSDSSSSNGSADKAAAKKTEPAKSSSASEKVA